MASLKIVAALALSLQYALQLIKSFMCSLMRVNCFLSPLCYSVKFVPNSSVYYLNHVHAHTLCPVLSSLIINLITVKPADNYKVACVNIPEERN